jgi:signal transduction histidine kinase
MRLPTTALRASAHSRRLHTILLALLLAGAAGVAALVYQVWRGQYDVILDSLLRERHLAVASLASRLDADLQAHLAQGTRYLLEDDLHSAAPRIQALKRRHTDLEQVLRFDAQGGMIYCVPGPDSQPEQYRRWIADRLSNALQDRPGNDMAIGAFADRFEGRKVLFGFSPIPEDLTRSQSGWLITRHDLGGLISKLWTPLQQGFVEQHGGWVGLVEGTPSLGGHDVAIPASTRLAGWTLHYRPDSARLSEVARSQSLLLGLLLLAVGSLPVMALAAWWWYVRQRLKLAQAKDDFVAHVSHELKTPLAVIRTNAETLALGRVGDETRRLAYLDTIVREAQRLTGMIEQVLDFAQGRQDGFRISLHAHDLGSTVRAIIETQRPRLAAEGFSLLCRTPAALPGVRHDPEGIGRVLVNLLDNAAKYSSPGQPIEISLAPFGDFVQLEVIDRGRGLGRDEAQHVVEPFVRGQAASKEGIKGVGLGLALVTRAVAAHGGRFQIAPREGGGVIARATFPRLEPAA